MSDWRPFIYGGLASMTAECGTFPIDTTKTRLQVQGQVIDAQLSNLKYRGMLHAFFRIAKEEGVHALYSGLAPALLRQATYGTIKIGIYHTLKRSIISNPAEETLPINVMCGIVAGVISSSIANPTDVLKVRMQANSTATKNQSMLLSFVNIYKQEGLAGLWRGVGPTAQRAAVVSGVELPAYDIIKKHILRSGYLGDSKGTHFVASFLAGFAGAIASNPIDVCKTRMMNQRNIKVQPVAASGSVGAVAGSTPSVIYTSSLDCLVQTVRTEGVTALYKGFIPNWLRLGPWNIIVTNVLVRGGANPRANPALPAFILAANLGYLRTLAYFLDIGQDPSQTDDRGWTALHFACMKGFTMVVEVLLSCGADPNGSDGSNASPLGLALFHRHKIIAQYLLASGCEVNKFDDELDTPLHFAAANGDLDTVQLLLDHGSKACVYNGIGATPLYNAVVSNNASIVKLFLPYYIDTDVNTLSQGFEYVEGYVKNILFADCSRSLLWVAASNANEVMVTGLLNAGFKASTEEWIHDRDFPQSLQSGEQTALTNMLVAAASAPLNLMLLCRCAVRRALGPGKQRSANSISIPRKIKNYIMLRDTDN